MGQVYSTFPSKQPSEVFKNAIKGDIALLERANFATKGRWSTANSFKHVPNTKVWIYSHGAHVSCSKAEYSNFQELCSMYNIKPNPSVCVDCPIDGHDALQPFYFNNLYLKRYFTETLTNLPDDSVRRGYIADQLTKVTAVLENQVDFKGTPFHTGQAADCPPSLFSENIWSRRLAASLEEFLPNDTVEYTAEDGPHFSFQQSVKSGIPNTLVSAYPFQGTPDIVIKKKTPIVIETASGGDSSPSGETSGEEHPIEHGKQADPLTNPVPKVGELLANMHISLVQKALRKFLNKPDKATDKEKVETTGLYIHKALGGYVCTMTIPVIQVENCPLTNIQEMEITVEDRTSGFLTRGQLCSCLEALLKKKIH